MHNIDSTVMKSLFLLIGMAATAVAFVAPNKKYSSVSKAFVPTRRNSFSRIYLADEEEDRLAQLGFDEPQRSQEPEQKVRVDLIEDVDPVTLTAIGFTLIAFNFLVFANMGDAGLSGIVARIINATS